MPTVLFSTGYIIVKKCGGLSVPQQVLPSSGGDRQWENIAVAKKFVSFFRTMALVVLSCLSLHLKQLC